MLRKVLKAIGWTAAGLVGLVVLLYLVALAVNWRDREPSAAAVRLTQLVQARPAVADADNAYIFLRSWELDPDRRQQRSSRVQAFIDACAPNRAACAAAFDHADGLFVEWSMADAALLDQYEDLASRSGWREPTPFTIDSIPSYSAAADGQKLLLLRARELAKQGDAESVRALLENDLRFWRMVLASSDILVSKMIATGALYRHFEWGNLILRSLPAAKQLTAIPAGWSAAVSDDERSMMRCIAGEWHFAAATLTSAPADFGADAEVPLARTLTRLLRPLFQPQATNNLYAEHYFSVARALDVPLSRYPGVVTDVQERAQQTANDLFPYAPVYNFPGSWLFAMTLSGSDLTSFAVRVSDIEGVRRAVLTAATLRASGVEAKDVAAALASAGQRDPYTEQPFVWDEASQSIVFRGLQSGERGEHRIYY